MDEPEIIINGQLLSVGEAMTLRVAVQAYITDLTSKKHPLGGDDIGKSIAKGYLRHLGTINEKMSS